MRQLTVRDLVLTREVEDGVGARVELALDGGSATGQGAMGLWEWAYWKEYTAELVDWAMLDVHRLSKRNMCTK